MSGNRFDVAGAARVFSEGINIDDFVQETVRKTAEKIDSLKTLNIIVAGKTGVGKSTLINGIFRENLAETGIGKPVTMKTCKLTKEGFPLAIYDTRGFELGTEVQKQIRQEVLKIIREGDASKDINQSIDFIWYCINTAAGRVEPEEIAWIRELTQEMEESETEVPVIVVLTQSFNQKNAQELRRVLLNENLDVIQIVPVLAEDYNLDGRHTAKAYGLDKLVEIVMQALPDEMADTFQFVQIADFESKMKHAHVAVGTAAATAAAVGATPIPFSDAFALVPVQAGMLAAITVIFGFNVNKDLLTSFATTTLASGGTTIVGKTIVSNILKFVPGAGSVAGGVISASTAAAITTALGEAYIAIMKLVYTGEMGVDELNTKKGRKRMEKMFKEKLKKSSK